jgi:hypothetical protein
VAWLAAPALLLPPWAQAQTPPKPAASAASAKPATAVHTERIDPRFREHFGGKPVALIRVDEVRWGGVRRDGIPPLKTPK